MLPPSRDAAAGLGGADEAPSGSLAALPEYALSVQPPDGAAAGGRSWSVGDSMRKLFRNFSHRGSFGADGEAAANVEKVAAEHNAKLGKSTSAVSEGSET